SSAPGIPAPRKGHSVTAMRPAPPGAGLRRVPVKREVNKAPAAFDRIVKREPAPPRSEMSRGGVRSRPIVVATGRLLWHTARNIACGRTGRGLWHLDLRALPPHDPVLA